MDSRQFVDRIEGNEDTDCHRIADKKSYEDFFNSGSSYSGRDFDIDSRYFINSEKVIKSNGWLEATDEISHIKFLVSGCS